LGGCCTNDVVVLEKLGIKVKLFADNAKLYLRVTDENDIIKLVINYLLAYLLTYRQLLLLSTES